MLVSEPGFPVTGQEKTRPMKERVLLMDCVCVWKPTCIGAKNDGTKFTATDPEQTS
jgi:hypothetical protein